MPDVLIRNIPSDDLERLDAHARREGLTRSEYLRRRLHLDAVRAPVRVRVEDLRSLESLTADLGDTQVMDEAWS